ncbi:VOC family protein [Terriglobus roseus]|uniref:Glyoxalase/Bleomycin resistance protein/Dioxygenase superfamily protein n=1 Tax=Terriglobus roseus TaxID=392734 RepID=A0A1H4MHQ6_9BACT|nr:VOC family protein [Terriglobus roseus]SEB82274.1 Glyoxalase/Bleomycin resistance protein/Dioxygenase superfamily protein [Terriglobus roseus]
MATTRDILLQTPHLQQATDFYRDVLGLEVFLTTPGMVGMEAGSFRLFLEDAEPLGPVLEFLTDDFDTTRRDLLDHGCTLIVEDPEIPRCYLRDPFGLIFNLALNPLANPTAQADADDPTLDRGNEKPPHY